MIHPDYNKARTEAENLLKAMNITSPIVNVFDVAEREGLKIKFFNPDEKLQAVAGFFNPADKTIYVNQEDPANRQVFTVAHELGHYKLEHEPSQYGVLMRWSSNHEKHPIEKEADEFAGNLLVPQSMLISTMKEYKLDGSDLDIELLSRLFGVAKEVIKIRLQRVKATT